MTAKQPPAFGPTQRLQHEYERGMREVVKRILAPKLPSQTFDQWVAELAERSRRPDVQSASEFLARKMFQWANITNARTWREAASKSQQSRKLFKLLTAEMRTATGARVTGLVRENAKLISSLPIVAAQTLTDEILKAQQSGARADTLAKMMRTRFPELMRSRVHLIARTETAKASTALTEARCAELSIDWYVWESSKDQRTRKSHKNLHGVLIPWAHAPSPEELVSLPSYGHYHAGTTFNCRCTQIPLLTFQDVSWPHRVYWGNSVSQMTLPEFKRIATGVETRAA